MITDYGKSPAGIDPDASRRFKFAWRNVFDSRNFFSEFLFPNSVLLCLLLEAVDWNYKSPTAIFSQPNFLTNI